MKQIQIALQSGMGGVLKLAFDPSVIVMRFSCTGRIDCI